MQFLSVINKLFNLSTEFCIFEDKSLKANGAYDTINHFACNFAKCSRIFKILSPAQ